MRRAVRHLILSLFIMLAWGTGWLMLWTLSFYLTHNGQQAVLFLPQGVWLALMILLSRHYWPALILPPLAAILWLHGEQLLTRYMMLTVPLIGIVSAWLAQRY